MIILTCALSPKDAINQEKIYRYSSSLNKCSVWSPRSHILLSLLSSQNEDVEACTFLRVLPKILKPGSYSTLRIRTLRTRTLRSAPHPQHAHHPHATLRSASARSASARYAPHPQHAPHPHPIHFEKVKIFLIFFCPQLRTNTFCSKEIR